MPRQHRTAIHERREGARLKPYDAPSLSLSGGNVQAAAEVRWGNPSTDPGFYRAEESEVLCDKEYGACRKEHGKGRKQAKRERQKSTHLPLWAAFGSILICASLE